MFSNTYIDIHRHANAVEPDTDVITLFNVHDHFDVVSPERQYSMGIHPWYIHDLEEAFVSLQNASNLPHVKAIGECGLDKIKGADFEWQLKAFEMQIQWANKIGKPLIIHCVRAFSEILELLKQSLVPVIFHGFNKRMSIANEILKHGYYVSFGAALLDDRSAAYTVFDTIPADRFFLETDDAEINIKDVYKAAADIRKTDIEAIIWQVQQNFKNVFNL